MFYIILSKTGYDMLKRKEIMLCCGSVFDEELGDVLEAFVMEEIKQ